MKTKILIANLIIMLIILLTSVSYAATGSVDLKVSANEVKKGDTITVTISASSQDGINGISTKYTYDSDKLEVISEGIANASNWANLGTPPNITIISNTSSKITNDDVYTIKFKVKENVTVGDTITIGTTEIVLDTDLASDSKVNILAKSVQIKVVDGSSSGGDGNNNTEDTNNTGDTNSTNDTNNTGDTNNTDNTNNAGNNNNTGNTNNSGNNGNNSGKNNNNKPDSTVSGNTMPKTGQNDLVIGILIIISIIFFGISYKRYSQNKDIK